MFPHFPLHSHPDMLHPYHPASPDLPSDFRAFYPYTPNEVKHRKRTTSTQLRTLENVFKRETKPNAALRNQLAEELKMTPRGVQVWFQNRRAKEKTKANKAKAAGEATKQQHAPSPTTGFSGPTSPDPSTTEAHPSDLPQAKSDQSLEIMISVDSAPSQPQLDRKAPAIITPPQLQLFSDPGSSGWEEKTATENDDTLTGSKQRSGELTAAQLYAMRRGSLPVHSPHEPMGSSLLCPPSALHRRASVDTNFHRPGQGIMPRGTLLRGQKLSPTRSPPQGRGAHGYSQGRPGLHPHQQYMDMRRGSMDSRTMFLSQRGTASPFQTPLFMHHGPRASLPIPNHMYSVPTRTLSPPGPGPLPTPNFQFGAASSATAMASSSSGDSDRNSPDSPNSFTYRETEGDDDNASIGSYMPHSRFGSFQSVATSESGSLYTDYTNLTSALPSPAILSGRRHSCTPTFVGLMSALGVNDGNPGAGQECNIGGSFPDEAHVASNEFTDTASSVNPVLNFPPSTGDAQEPLSTANLPVSRDSALAFALENQSQQKAT
ncbi:hypothetical protein JOM56_002464 [Amanita muscaria]